MRHEWAQLRAATRAHDFAAAQNVQEAAKAAVGAYMGRPEMPVMIRALQMPVAGGSLHLVKAKLQLLMAGEAAVNLNLELNAAQLMR